MTDTVVIGSGRTPEGQGWGSAINACSTVIRMWDCDWQGQEDYGVRYDFGFLEISPKQISWFQKNNARTPLTGWVASVIKPFKFEWTATPRTVYTISPARWVDIGLGLGGLGATGRLKLTRGCIAAAWATERMAEGDRLILVGFDNVYTGTALTPEEGFSDVYRAHPSTRPFKTYVGGGTKYHNHDYVAEGLILKKLTEVRGVELKHAQEIW